jgi:hypothetical protein
VWPFRRGETLNERLLREAELDAPREQTPVKANLNSAPDEPSSDQHPGEATSVLGVLRAPSATEPPHRRGTCYRRRRLVDWSSRLHRPAAWRSPRGEFGVLPLAQDSPTRERQLACASGVIPEHWPSPESLRFIHPDDSRRGGWVRQADPPSGALVGHCHDRS